MQRFGFFQEFHEGGQSFLPMMNPPYAWQAAVASYLESGRIVSFSPEIVEDPLSFGESAGTRAVQTDGEWVWPSELPYLVRSYGLMVPAAFLERMRSNSWVAPAVSDNVLSIADETARG